MLDFGKRPYKKKSKEVAMDRKEWKNINFNIMEPIHGLKK